MSTQLIGYSICGICKSILVDPPSMIWPSTLVNAALFNTMHSLETAGAQGFGGISRGRFFTYVFVAYFFYSEFVSPDLFDSRRVLHPLDFLPSYLFTALSSFSWVCWIAPNNVKINQLFGVSHGLAMGVLTFDWGQIIAFNGSPLPTPWWSAAHFGIAVILFSWFLVPVLYVSLHFQVLTSPHDFPAVHQHLVQRVLANGHLTIF